MNEIVQAVVSGLGAGSLFAMSGIGIVVIFRVTKLVNFAQGVFSVFAGYVMSSLLLADLGWVVAGLLSAVVSSLLAVVLSWFVLIRPSRNQLSSVFVLLGLSIIMEGVFVLGWGDQPVSYRAIVPGSLHLAGGVVEPEDLVLIVVMAVTVLILQLFFSRSYLGKAMTAASANRDAAKLVGISLFGVGTVAFALSGLIGGIAGVFSTATLPITNTSDIVFTIYGFAAAIVGDLKSPVGALAGGLVLGELESFVAASRFGGYQEVVALLGMLGVLLLRSGSIHFRLKARRSLL